MFLDRHLDRVLFFANTVEYYYSRRTLHPLLTRPGVESPLIRAATSSVLLTTWSRAAKKEVAPHPFYGSKLLTQRLLTQREREASMKPTATIGVNKGLDEASGSRKRALYLNDTRTVSTHNLFTNLFGCCFVEAAEFEAVDTLDFLFGMYPINHLGCVPTRTEPLAAHTYFSLQNKRKLAFLTAGRHKMRSRSLYLVEL